MMLSRQNISIVMAFALSVPALVPAASVYETQAEFLQRAFGHSPPEASMVWLSGERKTTVRQLLGHDYPALRLRYWCQEYRSAWILDEVGKELPITVGVIVDNDYIQSLRVLTYRENRGGEVTTAAFTDQFNGISLNTDGALAARIDGISGATLSVQALKRLATMALFLHDNTGCKDGS